MNRSLIVRALTLRQKAVNAVAGAGGCYVEGLWQGTSDPPLLAAPSCPALHLVWLWGVVMS